MFYQFNRELSMNNNKYVTNNFYFVVLKAVFSGMELTNYIFLVCNEGVHLDIIKARLCVFSCQETKLNKRNIW